MAIGSYVLKVTPEQLQEKAAEIDGQISRLTRVFESVFDIVVSSSNYWQGDAADLYRSNYKKEDKEAKIMFNRIKEHVADLNAIAQIYTGTEIKNKEIINQLPSDIIV